MMSAITSAYRSLARHKLFAALNIGGLALGIAVFLVLYLFVRFETEYDRMLPGSDKLWVVQRTMQFPGARAMQIPSPTDMLAQLRADYPDTVGTRMLAGKAAVRSGDFATQERLAQVDPNYFRLFPFDVISGSPGATLADPGGAIVTDRIARLYLRPGEPIGQTVAVTIGGKPHQYRVGAVIAEPPQNLTHRNDIFVALTPAAPTMFNGQDISGLVTFLRFPNAAAAAARLATLPAFNARHPDPNFAGPTNLIKMTETIVPLTSLHLAQPRDRAIVATLGIVGLIALLLAAVNYVNLATARADLRAREVAIRKVVGASRRALVGQFLAESLASTAIAALVALALLELALPLVNAAGGSKLAVDYLGRASILIPVVAVTLAIGIAAGLYPAFVLSRFRPVAVLSSTQAPGRGRQGQALRLTLVVGQFALAIALMIGTAVLLAQTRHIERSDLGFRRDGLVMVSSFADPTLDRAQRDTLQRRIAGLPGVNAITTSSVAAGGGSFGIGSMTRDGVTGPAPNILQYDIGPGFVSVYGARLIAGRGFDPDRFAMDATPKRADATGPLHTILNRTAVRTLGFRDPAAAIGQSLGLGEDQRAVVIGVVDDMRLGSPRTPVDAAAYYLKTDNLFAPVLAARYAGDGAQSLLDRIEQVWRQTAPGVPFRAQTVDRSLYEAYYQADTERSRLFTIGAVLAVVIGCLGLYGLAAFDTARRVREIGIRKVLGASTRDVLRLLVGQFVQPVLIANLIAWPIAYVAMRRWLAGFDDRIALSPWFFVGASVLALVIAVLTVIGQSWRVARAAPPSRFVAPEGSNACPPSPRSTVRSPDTSCSRCSTSAGWRSGSRCS